MIVREMTRDEIDFLGEYKNEWPILALKQVKDIDVNNYLIAVYDLIMQYGINSELRTYNDIGKYAQKIFNAINDEKRCFDNEIESNENEWLYVASDDVLKVSFNVRVFLRPYIIDWPIFELEELRHDDVDEYLLSLYDAIICYGFDKRMEFYNETGESLQLMCDQLLEWVEAQ